jgi:ribosomal protein S18 acetylase RimI-like enzyme
MAIEVREARSEEFAEAGRVTAEAYREFARAGDPDWAEYLERIADVEGRAPRATVLVAVEDDRIVGTATLELDGRIDDDHGTLAPNEAHIRMLGVHPDARGHGVARELMATCEDRSRAAGRTLMTLNTTLRMQTAQRMYESLGYIREEDRVFPDGFVLLSYSKQLV